MNLEENKEWQKIIEDSKGSNIGKTCVDIAIEVMKLLNNDDTPLHAGYYPDRHTPHGIICVAGRNMHIDYIPVVMIGVVTSLVAEFHDRGEEFGAIWGDSIKTNGIVNPA